MDNKQQPSALDQLMMAKDLTLRLGVIHEAQKLQLKMWAALVPGVTKGQAEVDIERKLVIYRCKAPKKFKRTPLFDKYCKEVTKWTRTILWSEANVMISVNGDSLYDTRF